MKTAQLNENVSIPLLGFGTWQMTGEVCKAAVQEALRVGYRHIDTADAYGNHSEVGEAITESGIAREDIFLTTKIWNTDHAHADVQRSAHRFLEELNTPYIDLLLIHWPVKDVPVRETLKAMAELKDTGIVRSIGVSNFTEHHLRDVFEEGIAIDNNQVEVHPLFNQAPLRGFCEEHDIVVTAYSPLGHARDLEDPVIQEIAQKHSVSPAQIALAWCMAKDMVTIPKSDKPARIKENFEAQNIALEADDIARIDELPQGPRTCNPAFNEFNY